jgi:predicted AAA+ superfamily ATPase
MRKEYIPRPDYLNRILPYVDQEIIKILIGQRRVGKSYLMFQLMDEIARSFPEAEMIYINKELYEFRALITWEDLINHIHSLKKTDRKSFVFIDEVQDIPEFEKALRSLLAEGGYDLYCTGSNARLLSGELASLLSGRYIEIKVYSLSYLEFLQFHKLENNQDSFFLYLKFGGMPYLKHLKLEEEIAYEYLRNIYNTIILKDVVARFRVRNTVMMQNLAIFLAANTGSIVSAKRISDFLKSQRIDIAAKVVIEYLNYLSSVFLVMAAKRYDINGRRIFEIGEKYYFEDTGLRNALVPFKQSDINKLFENLVYRHLISLGYTVSIGVLGDKEIDFIAERHSEKIYLQVAYLIADESTRIREFGNLQLIKDNYPKYVISGDEMPGSNEQGIKHLNIREFLSTSSW